MYISFNIKYVGDFKISFIVIGLGCNIIVILA